jgi:hypothetical protein
MRRRKEDGDGKVKKANRALRNSEKEESTGTFEFILYASAAVLRIQQCCGSGSGIGCLFDPCIRAESWMNNPDHIL